ncbi:hypothetical protein EJ05DRAFT_467758 [Pseudovirgaria hyperparasitica]|uniref:alpha-D-xyloside xylohydrolase n=1 Tax=Pseudovirgaria hyperparasitica TaxID=470096 RepID=A0A6A6VY50_9PEZI|nr:uncharacterized protein EJ05DRAFT_467758 [Pseudovirgaria hyperparasitica]KAF2755588.1 hypothetical protein EJ05DRAFT_467758 [Pseudovirgaria hyperparasitica]
MKFRDGMWLVAADKTVQYAEDIHTITPSQNNRSLSLLCPTRHIRSRGDTLNLATMSVDITAEFDGVISVEVAHFRGARKKGPDFELYPDGRPDGPSELLKDDKGTTLTSGRLAVTVGPNKDTFDIKFHESGNPGRDLTSLLSRSVGFAYTPALTSPKQVEDLVGAGIKHYIFTQTELGVGESIHGLGERFGAWNKVGQSIEVWNEDGGTSSEQAYKNVSFWLSNRGYGVFIDTPDKIELEIGSERSCRLQTSVEGHRLKWYIIYGPTPKEVLTKYSILTGKAGKVPAWSFGLWLSTSFTTNYDEATVSHFLEEMQSRQIPVEVFHYDCFWLKEFHWCDFEFDIAAFPDPAGSIKRLKSAGLMRKVCVWTNPYLGQASPIFAYAAEKGYLLKRPNGDIFQWDLWQTGMGIVDFTNPAAKEWFVGCLSKLFDLGVDCIKTDFGERIPTRDVAWHDTSVDPSRMHNYYSFIYNKCVYEALQSRYGADQAVLFARTACAGTQRFPLIWGGDCESTPPALAESLRGGLSIGLSSHTYWSSDIGGFEGSPPPWIYKRWVAFGLVCSHSRLHGSNSYRVPWLIDNDSKEKENCTEVLRTWVQLKRRLMPYLFAQAQESAEKGWPLSVRAMALEFPDDPTAWFCDRQFMLGSQLLVAPVFNEDGSVEFYLPPGRWTNFWSGEIVDTPGWRKESHGFLTLPLYVRDGTLLVLGKEPAETDTEGFAYDWLTDAELRLYSTKEGDKARLVDKSGVDVGILEVGDAGTVKGMDLLKGSPKVAHIVKE